MIECWGRSHNGFQERRNPPPSIGRLCSTQWESRYDDVGFKSLKGRNPFYAGRIHKREKEDGKWRSWRISSGFTVLRAIFFSFFFYFILISLLAKGVLFSKNSVISRVSGFEVRILINVWKLKELEFYQFLSISFVSIFSIKGYLANKNFLLRTTKVLLNEPN